MPERGPTSRQVELRFAKSEDSRIRAELINDVSEGMDVNDLATNSSRVETANALPIELE